MEHETYDHLANKLEVAANRVILGGFYSHYKNPAKLYRVEKLVILESTDEVAVLYSEKSNQQVFFVRSLTSWLETVEWDRKKQPRFNLFT